MPRTRALIITDFFYPHWTGLAKSVYNLVKGLKNTDVECTVLTVKSERGLKEEDEVEGARVVRARPQINISRTQLSFLLMVKSIGLIRQTDAVFINSPCAHILPVSLLARLMNKRLLIFHNGDLILREGIMNRIIERVFDVTMFIVCTLADGVTTYTEDYALTSRVLKKHLHKFTPLLMPVFVQKPSLAVVAKRFPELTSLKKNKKILVGFAGRFVYEKGFDILFQAIDKYRDELKNVVFVYAGEAVPYEHFLEEIREHLKKVEPAVIMLGRLDEASLMSFFELVDYIVVPSRSDCFPMVQSEAMIAGLPSMVSDIPGARYLVKTTGFGLLVKPEDPADLGRQLLKAISSRSTLMKNHEHVLSVLDNEKNVRAIRQYLKPRN